MSPSGSSVCMLRTALNPCGLDLVASTPLSHYNNAVSHTPSLVLPSPSPTVTSPTLVVIANTRALWEPFIHSLTTAASASDPSWCIPETPLDTYVTRTITTHAPVGSIVRFAHTDLPQSFCARTAAVAAQFGELHPDAHIVVDGSGAFAKPPLGPWISIRAVIVLAEEFDGLPGEKPEAIPRGFGAVPTSGWEDMVARRDALVADGASHCWRHSKEQIEYHYTWDVGVLKQAVDKSLECRRVVVGALKECLGQVREGAGRVAVLLSGGVDSSALVEAMEGGVRVSAGVVDLAVTVSVKGGETHTETHDLPHATRVAMSLHGLQHEHVVVDPEELLSSTVLGWVATTLSSFDPMELRNAVVMGVALQRAKELGCTAVVTGDGADELFGGYSFTHKLSGEAFQAQRDKMVANMSFSTAKLGAALDINVLQPYLEPQVMRFAMGCERGDLVVLGSRRDSNSMLVPSMEGKGVLRRAFADSISALRPKVPIESGSGSTILRLGYFDSRMPSAEFVQRVEEAKSEHSVVLRDREHVVYFSTLLERLGGTLDSLASSRGRFGENRCKDCFFNLETPTQDFCMTCGCWPAQTVGEEFSNR